MRRLITLGGALVVWCLAASARADNRIEYSFVQSAAQAGVTGGGRSYDGFRIEAGGQVVLSAKGPGVFKIFYFQEYQPGKPFPTDVRLLVSVDGAGKLFPITAKPLPGLQLVGRKGVLPSAPTPVNLQLANGEHKIVLRLATNGGFGGVLAFPDAKLKGGDLDLDLDLAPAKPVAVASLDLPVDDFGLDLPSLDDVPPAKASPAKAAPAKPAAADLDLDLDLGFDPPPAQPAAPTPPIAPPQPPVAVAAKTTPAPAKPTPAKPTPAPAAKPEPAVAAKAPPARPAPPPPREERPKVAAKPRKQKPAAMVAPVPEAPPQPPPALGDLEAGGRAGYALARGRLKGQGVYLFEIGYRLQSMPKVRLTFTSGYTLLTGAWRGIEPGRGLGWFHQNTQVVPLEAGATFQPVSFGDFDRFGLFVGAAASVSLASTSMQRFSLAEVPAAGTSFGVTVSTGLRAQIARGVFVFELRHTESAASRAAVAGVGEQVLSASAATAGYLLSF